MIQTDKLTMHYGQVVALENASFEVRQGEVVGLLGPNGAGKSTTMKILTTYLWPTSGTAKICGIDILTSPIDVRKKIGYLPEILPLYMDMEVGKYLEFVGQARGMDAKNLKDRLNWVVERCGLRKMYRSLIRELSKGYKQRTALAQALLHDPEVIILDEPTSGLDPHQIIEIRKLIKELSKNKTVILSSHILGEVEAVSDRIVIISRGCIVANGSIPELQKKAMHLQRVRVAALGQDKEIDAGLRALQNVKSVTALPRKEGAPHFKIEAEQGSRLLHDVVELMKGKGWELVELQEDPFSLEETFLALTEAEEGLIKRGGAA